MQAKEYRPDIDVLRAIAVLAVIFYHAHVPYFTGGYVGVSIFFVISGYLITGIIKRKLENDSFSFAEFYENRIRRILPALLFVLLVSMALAFLLYDKGSFYDFQRMAKRAVIGFANFHFYQNTNYFDPAAETLSLLHTWSLAVEEQFYFVFPLILFVCYYYLFNRSKTKIIFLLGVLFAVSFFLSIWYVSVNQKFTFYMLPTRAWELMAGGLLAYTGWTPSGQKSKGLCLLVGIMLMFGSITLYTTAVYPGIWALPPCLGACLYIAGATGNKSIYEKSFFGYLCNNKILIFIGVISYSLYLWHWPVLLFYRHIALTAENSVTEIFVLLVVIFLLSAFSWRFVEQPVRRAVFFKKKKIVWGFAVLGIGFVMFLTSAYRSNHFSLVYTMTLPAAYEDFPDYSGQKDIDVFLVGDSHSESMKNLFAELAKKHGLVAKFNRQYKMKGATDVPLHVGEIQNTTAFYSDHAIKNVFLIFRWTAHYNNKFIYYNSQHVGKPFVYLENPELDGDSAFEASVMAMIHEAKTNGAEHIYIMLPLPEPKACVPQKASVLDFIYSYSEDETNLLLGESAEEYEKRTKDVCRILEKISKKVPEVKLVAVAESFYDAKLDRYLSLKNDVVYYFDDDHLCVEGTMLLYGIYDRIFAEIAKQKTNKN